MRISVLFAIMLVATTARSQGYPELPGQGEMIDPQREISSLGSLNGVWKGFLEVMSDPVGAYRDNPAGFDVQITIQATTADVVAYDQNNDPKPLAARYFVHRAESAIVIVAMTSEYAFVESFSIFLAHVGKDRLEGYVSRNVHNYTVRATSPWRVVPVQGRLIMDRVR